MSYNIQRKQLQNPLSASYADTASYVNPLLQDVQITGSILLSGSAVISKVEYIDFVITGSETYPAHQTGRLHWYDDGKTLNIDTDVNGFMIEVGHQNVVRVRNLNPFTLNAGAVVYINGSSGAGRPTVATASWTGDPTSASTLGFVAQTILNNGTGYVITNGLVRKVNTTGFTEGDQLYLSSSGHYTNIVPDAPNHEVRLGKVIRGNSANEGIIYVDIMNGYELTELHDVKTNSYSSGDLLIRSSSLWINSKQLTGSYGLTGSLTVTGGGITGSLFGTASWAYDSIMAISSSHSLYANAADTSNSSIYATTSGKTNQITIESFNSVASGVKNHFSIFDGMDNPSIPSDETLYDQSLLTYEKDSNRYEFLTNPDTKVAPDIIIGDTESTTKANVFVYGNVIATGIISAPNLSTGLNTLTFVSDYSKPTQSIAASLSVSTGSLVLSATSFVTSMLTLTPTHPLPANPATGSFAVSASSPPKPYFYNGTSWNSLY